MDIEHIQESWWSLEGKKSDHLLKFVELFNPLHTSKNKRHENSCISQKDGGEIWTSNLKLRLRKRAHLLQQMIRLQQLGCLESSGWFRGSKGYHPSRCTSLPSEVLLLSLLLFQTKNPMTIWSFKKEYCKVFRSEILIFAEIRVIQLPKNLWSDWICTSSTRTRSFKSPDSSCCTNSSIFWILYGMEMVDVLAWIWIAILFVRSCTLWRESTTKKLNERTVHHWLVFLSPAQVVFRFAPSVLSLKAPAHLSFHRNK